MASIYVPEQTPAPVVEDFKEQTPALKIIEEEKEKERTFSQDELDKIVQDRLAKERKKYGDYNDLKAKAAEAEQLKAEKLTEAERMQARLKELEASDAAKAAELAEKELLDTARSGVEKMIADGKITLTKGLTITDVLDLVNVNDENELDYDKLLRAFPASKGLGGGTQQGHSALPSQTLQERVNDLIKRGKMVEAIALKNAYMRGQHPELWNK